MRVLIIEDEAKIARRIERITKEILGNKIEWIKIFDSVSEGKDFLVNNTIDLLLLDLNLNGEDGFEVLKEVVSEQFHTIIISAYKEKAITAFEYAVLDFISKPFNLGRLEQAFLRITNLENNNSNKLKYLSVKSKGGINLIDITDLKYIKGAGIYTELHLKNGTKEIHDKSLERLMQVLPSHFERIHKSYLVDMKQANEINIASGSKYELVLKNDETLPIGRTKYKELKEKWIL